MFYKAGAVLGLAISAALCFSTVARAQAGNADFQQAVVAYQQSPNDATAGKVIKLAAAMDRLPPIPEEARRHYVIAQEFAEKAKSDTERAKDSSDLKLANAGFERAAGEYKAALLAAPWWADVYKKLALVQKAANQYDDAVASLNLYLLTQPADARDAQDEIYKLEADKETTAAQKSIEDQRAQQQAVAASPQNSFDALLSKIDGRRYTCEILTIDRSDNDAIKPVTSVIDIRGRSFMFGYIGAARHPDYSSWGTD